MTLIEFETTGTHTICINQKHIVSISGVPDGKTCEIFMTDGLSCEVKFNVRELANKLAGI